MRGIAVVFIICFLVTTPAFPEDFNSLLEKEREEVDRIIEEFAFEYWHNDKPKRNEMIEDQTKAYYEIMSLDDQKGFNKGILDRAIDRWYPDFKMILYVYNNRMLKAARKRVKEEEKKEERLHKRRELLGVGSESGEATE